jgi:hypothetical protein
MYVYIRSEKNLWTVGFYARNGRFVSESDHDSPEDAARRVHYLNGGTEDIVAFTKPIKERKSESGQKRDIRR